MRKRKFAAYRQLLLLLTLMMTLSLCGCTWNGEEKTLSEIITELENFRLPGLRDDPVVTPAQDAVSGVDTDDASLLSGEENVGAADSEALLAHAAYEKSLHAILGEWSELSDALPVFRPIISWFGNLKLLEDGVYASASGTGTWELNPDGTQITLRGSRGKTMIDIVQDGAYLKLSVPELHLNFLRSSELNDYIAERFVFIDITRENVRDYIAAPVNIGEILDEKEKRTGKSAWVLGSSAYQEGLVYYGRSEDFHLELQNNSTGTMNIILPYDTLSLTTGAVFGNVLEADGKLVYIRSEYVSDNRMTDARTRTLTFTDGTTHTTSMTWYSDLASYSDWVF